MGDPSIEVPLPPSVEKLIHSICLQQSLPPIDVAARRRLLSLGEQASISLLNTISTSKIKNFSGFVIFMCNKHTCSPQSPTLSISPQTPVRASPASASIHRQNDSVYNSPIPRTLIFSPASNSKRENTHKISEQLLILSELEFRKMFLILSYIGSNKLEDVMSDSSASKLLETKDLPMQDFESEIWRTYGSEYCDQTDRRKCIDWDAGKTHLYYCHVSPDGSYYFKGPYLNTTRTHLQRALGDDNVLIVKFAEDSLDSTNMANGSNRNLAYVKIFEEGIPVGLRRYRFFVFKDGGKEGRKKTATSSAVKCYFVRMESIAPYDEIEPYILSNKTIHEARRLFMHVHTVKSMAKYAARLSLILSQTIKLQIDLGFVDIEQIEDIKCRDEYGRIVCNIDGDPLIHTDGTGYISEDLAMKCPKDFYNAKYMKNENFERFLDHVNFEERSLKMRTEACVKEPPLLIQCRLFKNGLAVKGTLLINKRLKPNKIQIRPSMIKVETDPSLLHTQSFDSLEVVAISNKSRKNYLSKNLIALLSFGGVPREYFLGLLTVALEDVQCVFSNKRAALKVSMNHGEIDDDFTTTRMILAGVPLNEPCLQHRLSRLANEERKGLKGGRLPISESFYLMGTADPTGLLKEDQVCVILESGQISGKVLVYRNPGLHFGDIHVLNATYVKELEDVIGNAKYGIFFSTKGQRSVANEIANGDFDGDIYWVSRNPQLLTTFKPSKPWQRIYSTPDAVSRRPTEFSSSDELEREFFQLFLNSRSQSIAGVAADSWLAFMDRLLILGGGSLSETECMREKMHMLVDMYYDALDAPKSGKKVKIPKELRAEMFPHYMERENKCHSTSVLGLIYDSIYLSQTENSSTEDIRKLPCFDVEIPKSYFEFWKKRYDNYRQEMTEALKSSEESKSYAADEVAKKYKQMVYGANEFEESLRKTEDIYNDALALYHVTYEHAKSSRDVGKCSFAWKVAGSALCKFYAMKQSEKSMVCLPSVLREVLN